jgi:hypothetical protein
MDHITVLKIYLNDQNNLGASIDLFSGQNKTDFVFYPEEEEVIFLPMFTFQVIDI